MQIEKHPIWNNIKSYKKPFHFFRFFLAKNIAKVYPRSAFIGITGSVGKTTTSKACLAVLLQKYQVLATSENLDPIFNIPITLLKLTPKIKKVILEMGVEYPGEMDFYLSLVKPASAIVTRIYFAHSEFLGGLEQIYHEKSKLIKQLPSDGFAILNGDDPYVRKMAHDTKAEVIFFGTNSNTSSVWAGNIRLENFLTCFELNYGVERVKVEYQLLGKHQVYSALAAAALGISCELSLINIKKGLESVEAAAHRLQPLIGVNGSTVLDDTYNSSPTALEEALNTLKELPARKRIAILGEMKELGIYSEKLHRQIAQKIYKDKMDLVILGGGNTKYVAEELISLGFSEEKVLVNLTNSQIVSKIISSVSKGDVILVKGSRALRLDEVVKRITKQR